MIPWVIAASTSAAEHGAEHAAAPAVPEVPNLVTFLIEFTKGTHFAHPLHFWENIIFSWAVLLILGALVYFGLRKKKLIPSGLQNVIEMAFEALDNVVCGVMGERGRRYSPFIATLFLYIFLMNMSGLVPGLKSSTSNLNVTLGMAITVFCYVQITGLRELGPLGYLHHMAGSPHDAIGWFMSVLMFPLHVMEELIKPISLSLRLFGNILGEDALIGVFVLLGVACTNLMFGSGFELAAALRHEGHVSIPIGLPLQVPFMLLAILTGTIQALVFSLLSTIYIFMMLPHEEHH